MTSRGHRAGFGLRERHSSAVPARVCASLTGFPDGRQRSQLNYHPGSYLATEPPHPGHFPIPAVKPRTKNRWLPRYKTIIGRIDSRTPVMISGSFVAKRP